MKYALIIVLLASVPATAMAGETHLVRCHQNIDTGQVLYDLPPGSDYMFHSTQQWWQPSYLGQEWRNGSCEIVIEHRYYGDDYDWRNRAPSYSPYAHFGPTEPYPW